MPELNFDVIASTAVASFALPYVKAGSTVIVAEAKKKFKEKTGEAIGVLSEQVWDKIKSVFTSDREKGTIQDFEEHPEETADLLIAKLKAKLKENQQFATELKNLMDEPLGDGEQTSGAQIMSAVNAAIIDMRNSDFRNAKDTNISAITFSDLKSDINKGHGDS